MCVKSNLISIFRGVWTTDGEEMRYICGRHEHASPGGVRCSAPYWVVTSVFWPRKLVCYFAKIYSAIRWLPLFSRYDLKDTSKISLVEVIIVAAMGPPGGARNPVTQRFLRHFNIVSTLEFNDDTMVKIFSSLMSFHMRAHEFPSDLLVVSQQIVSATMNVSVISFCSIKVCVNLKVLFTNSFFFFWWGGGC